MAKRKKKLPKELRVCNSCGESFELQTTGIMSIQTMIDHYEKKHPDRMAKCFDDYGQTWNVQYDTCLKALHNTTAQRDEAIRQRDEIAAQQRSLAAKLNAIVLVLRNE